jgi:hypothetical protein
LAHFIYLSCYGKNWNNRILGINLITRIVTRLDNSTLV